MAWWAAGVALIWVARLGEWAVTPQPAADSPGCPLRGHLGGWSAEFSPQWQQEQLPQAASL